MHGSDEPASIVTLSGDDVPTVPDATLERGASVGRYLLLDELGRGGMGIVYAAFDPELDRKVAIKLLRVRDEDPTLGRARLLREAKAMARLDHPNAVAVHDVGTFGEDVFVAMEFVDGVTLRAWARARPRRWPAIVEVMVLAGRGLAAAHAAGLVHGDFKPDNVMITPPGVPGEHRVRVMDFGLARREGEETGADEHDRAPMRLVGTPGYVAPERLAGQPSDARADQFAFGVALWELLYGVPAFAGTTPLEIASNVVRGELATPPRNTEVPAWVRAIVVRSLSSAPQDRFATLDEMLAALARDPSRARRNAVLLLAAAGIVAGAFAAQRIQQASAVAACETAGAEIRGVWNDHERARVRTAIEGSGAGNAATIWEKLAPLLDAYADEWSSTRSRMCVATEIDRTLVGESAQRSRECLEERRLDFAALLDVFGEADANRVQQAVESAALLDRVAACEDERALAERTLPPPDDVLREQLRALQLRFAEAAALQQAGATELAVDHLRLVVADADTLAWPPAVARAHLRLGRALDAAGHYEEAESELRAAYFIAGKAGADAIGEDAATHLVQTVGSHLVRFADALTWAEHARMLHGRRAEPEDDLRVGRLELVLGQVANSQGDLEASLHHYHRALAIREAQLGAEHLEVASALLGIGRTLSARGEYEASLEYDRRALEIREQALGRDHPLVAGSLVSLSNTALALGRYDEALAEAERALVICERAYGRESLDTANALTTLGNVSKSRGDIDHAAEYHERALEIRKRLLAADHPELARAMQNLALARSGQGRRAEAEALFVAALTIMERKLGPEHRDVARTLMNLGNVQAAEGRIDEASASIGRSLAIWERVDGPEHPDVARALGNLGLLERRRGHYDEAIALQRRALGIRERTLGATHPHLAYTLLDLASTELDAGRPAQAIAPLERAVEILRTNRTSAAASAPTWFALARALRAAGRDAARACALARDARDALRDGGAAATKVLDEIGPWLGDCPG